MRWPQSIRESFVWFHFSGLVSLPNYYEDQRQTNLHRVYSTLVVGFFNLYMTSVTVTILVFCTRDFSEFCQKFFEWISGLDMAFAIMLVNYDIDKKVGLLDAMDEFGYYHRTNEILVDWERRSRRTISLGWKILAYFLLGK